MNSICDLHIRATTKTNTSARAQFLYALIHSQGCLSRKYPNTCVGQFQRTCVQDSRTNFHEWTPLDQYTIIIHYDHQHTNGIVYLYYSSPVPAEIYMDVITAFTAVLKDKIVPHLDSIATRTPDTRPKIIVSQERTSGLTFINRVGVGKSTAGLDRMISPSATHWYLFPYVGTNSCYSMAGLWSHKLYHATTRRKRNADAESTHAALSRQVSHSHHDRINEMRIFELYFYLFPLGMTFSLDISVLVYCGCIP